MHAIVTSYLTRVTRVAVPLAALGAAAQLVPWQRIWAAPRSRRLREEARRFFAKLADTAATAPALALNAVRYGLIPAAPSVVLTAVREGVSEIHWKGLGDAIVRTARHSGPVLTKLGQILATRNDVLPDAVCERLQALYACQPPMSASELTRMLETEFPQGLPFRSFDRRPVGVGSVGQVHRAQLASGQAVVVKLLRPGVDRAIERDLNALEVLLDVTLRIAGAGGGRARGAAARALQDLGAALRGEVDLRREADAVEEFERRFRGNPRVRVPIVYRQWSSRRVLVMEELHGEPLSSFRARAKTDPDAARKVASLAIREILTQVFDDGRFHADPHAGNLLILPDGRLGLIDLGLVGEAAPQDRKRIAAAVRAFMSGDPDVLCRTLLEFGTPPEGFDFEAFKTDIVSVVRRNQTAVYSHVTGAPNGDGGGGNANRLEQFVNDLFRVAYAHELSVPRGTTLLVKTLVTVEGVARSLDPSINIVAAALPIVLRSLAPRWLRWTLW
jgi:ubiquinone biosynthesis protein